MGWDWIGETWKGMGGGRKLFHLGEVVVMGNEGRLLSGGLWGGRRDGGREGIRACGDCGVILDRWGGSRSSVED